VISRLLSIMRHASGRAWTANERALTRARGRTTGERARARRSARARGTPSNARRNVTSRATASTGDLINRARALTNDLMDMKTSMPTVRRAVAGNRNDLVALKLYQDALEGKVSSDDDEREKLERVLDLLAKYVVQKAEEEQFWYDTENKVQSSVVDNTNLTEEEKREVSGMVANVAMWGVQGAVWNALILLVGFVSLVTFVLPNI